MAENKFPDFITAPPRGWTGVAALIGVGIIGNLLSAIVQIASNNSMQFLGLLVVSIILFLFALYRLWRLRPKAAELKVLTTREMHPKRKKGLIVLVGPGRPDADPTKQAAWTAIEHHRRNEDGTPCLRVSWVITSGGREGGLPVAQKLREEFENKGIQIIIHTVSDAFNMRETFDLVDRIYASEAAEKGLTADDIVSDFTGATKPMSAGMVLACGARYPMEYVFGGRDIASEPVAMRFA